VGCSWVETLASSLIFGSCGSEYCLLWGVERVAVGWGWGGQGILLGPEATSVRAWGLWQSRAARHTGFWFLCVPGVLVVGVGVGGCALFENYTVDASIFVVKLLRADGGCLGTRSR
jgi:hypothetical protein